MAAQPFPLQVKTIGRSPVSGALADFNSDGFLDVAAANFYSDDVSVLLGRGDGTFHDDARYAVGRMPVALTVGDFDGNGTLDMVVATSGQYDLTLLPGRGDGTFLDQSHFSQIGLPSFVTSADFNRDGLLDLAVMSSGNNSLEILPGRGDGTFGARSFFASILSPGAALVGDFNGDGLHDLAVTGYIYPTGGVIVLLGRGDGTFGPRKDTPVPAGSLASGDLDGDGIVDLALTGLDSISLLTGRGDGTFDPPYSSPAGQAPTSVAMADLNGDGLLDVVASNRGLYPDYASALSVYLGRGDGTAGPQSRLDVGAGVTPRFVSTADLDADGRADLVVVDQDVDQVSVLLGRGDGSFGTPAFVPTGFFPYSMATGDFDDDGIEDVAVVRHDFADPLTVLFGGGDGAFRSQTRLDVAPGHGLYDVVVNDFDSDGFQDLAISDAATSEILVVPGRGDGTFAPYRSFEAGPTPLSLAAADFNRDGNVDLACGNHDDASVSVLLGHGDGTFEAQRLFDVGVYPRALASADLDADGIPDLAVASYVSNTLSVLLGRGDGTFRPQVAYATGDAPKRVESGDFNDDGLVDLAVVNYGSDDVSILLGVGGGQFSPQRRFGAGVKPTSVIVRDFDLDGRQDLAVADEVDGSYLARYVSFLRGLGNGDFAPSIRYRAGGSPSDIASADLDLDGRPDLIVADYRSGNVTLLLNQRPPAARTPTADAGADRGAGCTSPAGAAVVLDGTASTDANGLPGTDGDIVSFEWFEDFGSPSEAFLGADVRLSVTLPLGDHSITLKVTDRAGATSTDEVLVRILDTTPPTLSLMLSPTTLWPPNHRLVPVEAAREVSDVCDPEPAVVLVSATSSEPDDAPGSGDGNTTEDIQNAATGTSPTLLLMRAERAADGPGRVYTVTYAATDDSGNSSSAVGVVSVPHDLETGPEPLLIHLEPDSTPGAAHLSWNAVPGALGYDIIQGDLRQLTQVNGQIRLGSVQVIAAGLSATTYSEGSTGTVPPAGSAYFYLVQYQAAQGASGWGTESCAWPAEPSSCDVDCP